MVGAGLAGGLLALEAADRGAKVCIISTAPMATPISYGGVQLAALEQWQRLEKRHGFLGLEPAELLLYWLEDQKPNIPPGAQRLEPSQWRGLEPLLVDAPLGGVVAMPYARVDPLVLTEKLTKALAAAGVQQRNLLLQGLLLEEGVVRGCKTNAGEEILARHTVLAAGAATAPLLASIGCSLPLLDCSWAALLQLEAGLLDDFFCGHASDQPKAIVMPMELKRMERERSTSGAQLICDGGIAPWGKAKVFGQASFFGEPIGHIDKPNPAVMRAGLKEAAKSLLPQQLWPSLAELPMALQPVAFSRDGFALVGPISRFKGLSVFTAFSAAFSLVPGLAPVLAAAILDPKRSMEALSNLELLPERLPAI